MRNRIEAGLRLSFTGSTFPCLSATQYGTWHKIGNVVIYCGILGFEKSQFISYDPADEVIVQFLSRTNVLSWGAGQHIIGQRLSVEQTNPGKPTNTTFYLVPAANTGYFYLEAQRKNKPVRRVTFGDLVEGVTYEFNFQGVVLIE